MAMIEPGEGKKYERDPEEGNIPTGIYLAELTEVREVGPSKKYPDGNNRLVFEFTVVDPKFPKLGGKKACAFVGKTLFKNKEGRESALVKLARTMGVANPEKGFDPDALKGRRYSVMIEYTDGVNGEPGRGWVRNAMVAPDAPTFAGKPDTGPTPDDAPPDDDLTPGAAAKWDVYDGKAKAWALNKSTLEVQGTFDLSGGDPAAVYVRPHGTKDSKRAIEYGFTSAGPIPY